MTRWIGKRGLWGVVAGTAVATGAMVSATEPGDTVVFKDGAKDRKVTVTKVNKKADGSVEVHGKDAAGEAITWVEGPAAAAPAAGGKAPAAPAAKDAAPPKAKARADDPIGSPAAPAPETPTERDRRLFNGKLLGRDTPAPTPAAAAPAMPQVAEAAEPKQKTGILNRLFGKKAPPVPTAMPGPAVTTPTPAAPVSKAGPTAGPTPAAPVSKAGPTAGPTVGAEPRVAPPVRPAPPAATPAPAPVKTAAPAAVPSPGIPVPMPLPASRPAAPPVSAPTAAPVATPTAIPVPTPLPPVVPLPTIPGLPGGSQSLRPGEPLHVVLPVGYVPAEVAMNDDLRPYAAKLRDGSAAPAERMIAAKGLADGRHGSTDRVKAMLFAAAQEDPAAPVRAACVDHLVRLGYYHPDFVRHLQTLADGTAGEERDAARAGLAKMTPRRW